MAPMNPRDPAIEYALMLTNGLIFYTGGFDEVPTASSLHWEGGIAGAFSTSVNVPWYITYIDPAHIVAVIDYRHDVANQS